MSDFLFAHPSVWSGVARLMDLGGVFDEYNTSPTPEVADAQAMRADWLSVGDDLRAAMEKGAPAGEAAELSA